MSAFTIEQQLAIEGAAAQIYERENTDVRKPHYWPALKSNIKDSYRRVAQRKLRTGEIAGWPK